jgi:hypothetical protein
MGGKEACQVRMSNIKTAHSKMMPVYDLPLASEDTTINRRTAFVMNFMVE